MEIKEVNGAKYKLASESERSAAKSKMEKMRKDGEKLVKGMFEFIDAQGGWIDFSYRFFPGEPIRTVHISHGEIVDLPMTLVKHLNNIWKKVRVPIEGAQPDTRKGGFPMTTERYSRTRFTPMEVM